MSFNRVLILFAGAFISGAFAHSLSTRSVDQGLRDCSPKAIRSFFWRSLADNKAAGPLVMQIKSECPAFDPETLNPNEDLGFRPLKR